MPLERIIDKGNTGQVVIWKLTETTNVLLQQIELSEHDQQILNSFKLDKRRQEWICARILLQQLLRCYPHIDYTDNGKPYLKDRSKHISISHASGYVAVSISDHPTALDIEICSARVEKAASRFVHDDEWAFINDKHKITLLTLIWSAKETLYKYFDEWGVVFKTHFRLQPFELKEAGLIQSHCSYKHYNQNLDLNYEVTPDYALVYHLND